MPGPFSLFIAKPKFIIHVKDVNGEAQTLKMSKYFSSIEYIPLQTNEESLLGNVLLFSGGNGQYNFASPGDEIRCFNHRGEQSGACGCNAKIVASNP